MRCCLKLNLYLPAMPKRSVSLSTRTCCIIFFCCACLFTSAQQADSLRVILTHSIIPAEKAFAFARLAILLNESDEDSAYVLALQGIQLSEKIKNDTVLAWCYRALGLNYSESQKKDSAEYFLLKARALFHNLKDTHNEAICLLNLGNFYLDDHQYMKGINSLMTAKRLALSINDMESSGRIDYELGSAYADQGLYDQGKQYIRASITMFKKLNKPAFLADAYSSIGYVFLQEGDYDSALYYYRLEYIIRTHSNYSILMQAMSADNIGTVYYEKANEKDTHPWIDSSYKYFSIALNNYIAVDSKWNIKYEEINMGSVLRNLKQYALASRYLLDAFHYFDSLYDVNYAYMAANELSILYKDMNDYEDAYSYKEISLKYKDSLDKRNHSDSITQIFARYETDKKEKQIQLLNAQSALDKSTLSRQRILMLFSVISLLFAAALFIVLINRNRMKQQLKEIKVRNQLAGDLHDEVGSSLSSILLLSKMASGKTDAQTSGKGMLDTIAANTKEVINKMNDIVWMMNPKYDEGENVREKLEQYVSNIQEATTAALELHIASAIDSIKFPMEIRKAILLVCKEAVNNALKYSNASIISISMNSENNHAQLIISDNGNGFDKDVVKEGNGLSTMNLRAKEINGKLAIQSSPGNGTQVKLVFSIPHSR